MLVDTETYIDCPYRYGPVAQVPGRRSPIGQLRPPTCVHRPDRPSGQVFARLANGLCNAQIRFVLGVAPPFTLRLAFGGV
jgi:hypothetical protein